MSYRGHEKHMECIKGHIRNGSMTYAPATYAPPTIAPKNATNAPRQMLRDICSGDNCSADICSADICSGDTCSADNCSADNCSADNCSRCSEDTTIAPATDFQELLRGLLEDMRHLLRRYIIIVSWAERASKYRPTEATPMHPGRATCNGQTYPGGGGGECQSPPAKILTFYAWNLINNIFWA